MLDTTKERLRHHVERIERIEEEKRAASADIKDILLQAKGEGFDVKVIRKLVQERRKDPNERQEFEAVFDTYAHALGMTQRSLFDGPTVGESVVTHAS